MGKHIHEYCSGHAKWLAEQYGLAVEKVKKGAIVLGEDHLDPSARAVICDLIEEGCLKKLFLELPWSSSAEELEKSIDGLLFKVKCSFADNYYGKEQAIPFAVLIPFAVKNGVAVHCFDKFLKGVKPGDPGPMLERNKYMAEQFKNYAKPTEVFVAALVGASHATAEGMGKKEHTLQSLCEIPDNYFFDLSEPKTG